ncbi:Rid family detoxifying hydrolase [Alicyclobacillus fastidiosus]|uniref:Rid family detoxifying hydrolase n=1 Tax=Alicyclobacillus fastidiosus TaxID=392011 RepID=A0ABY6ZI54_9BACL|nr:Rid family detoxifying hydrolase [Alicyclobacillus fastidiosus]WAH42202.1 Rid family detoxifying hydrolase [Alicyclobacillus fastidiosus]
MFMKIIHSNAAPAAIGPYSQAVEVGPFLYTSGQIPLTAAGDVVEGDIGAQVKQVFANLDAVLTEAQASRNQVVKATIFMTNLADFGVVNSACETFFGDHKPARSTVQVAALPRGVQVEIELIVYKG